MSGQGMPGNHLFPSPNLGLLLFWKDNLNWISAHGLTA